MNINEILKYANLDKDFGADKWGIESILYEMNIKLEIDNDLFNAEKGPELFKKFIIYEYSVDDHCGEYSIFTFKDVPFARLMTPHEDSMDYDILNLETFKDVTNFCIKCCKPIIREDHLPICDLSYDDFPLLQMFDSTYNIMGHNLLYVEDDGSFTKIERYWQDPQKIEEDHKKNAPYKNMYYYNNFEIQTNGTQRTVPYRHIVGVLGDNAELADKIVKTMNLNKDPEFEYMFKGLNFIKLSE